MNFRKIFLSALSLTISLAAMAAMSASAVAEKTAAKLKSAPSFTATFTVGQGENRLSGSLTMAAERFCLKVPGMQTWYDGLTQWTLSESAGEVNITSPTRREVIETNLLAVIGELKKNYSLRLLSAPKGFYKVELTPRQKSGAMLQRAVVTVNASTWLPTEIVVTGTDGRATVVRVNSLKLGDKMDVSQFKFNPKKFPGVEIVDLR